MRRNGDSAAAAAAFTAAIALFRVCALEINHHVFTNRCSFYFNFNFSLSHFVPPSLILTHSLTHFVSHFRHIFLAIRVCIFHKVMDMSCYQIICHLFIDVETCWCMFLRN